MANGGRLASLWGVIYTKSVFKHVVLGIFLALIIVAIFLVRLRRGIPASVTEQKPTPEDHHGEVKSPSPQQDAANNIMARETELCSLIKNTRKKRGSKALNQDSVPNESWPLDAPAREQLGNRTDSESHLQPSDGHGHLNIVQNGGISNVYTPHDGDAEIGIANDGTAQKDDGFGRDGIGIGIANNESPPKVDGFASDEIGHGNDESVQKADGFSINDIESSTQHQPETPRSNNVRSIYVSSKGRTGKYISKAINVLMRQSPVSGEEEDGVHYQSGNKSREDVLLKAMGNAAITKARQVAKGVKDKVPHCSCTDTKSAISSSGSVVREEVCIRLFVDDAKTKRKKKKKKKRNERRSTDMAMEQLEVPSLDMAIEQPEVPSPDITMEQPGGANAEIPMPATTMEESERPITENKIDGDYIVQDENNGNESFRCITYLFNEQLSLDLKSIGFDINSIRGGL
eukprot:Gb_36656 [translate_table: standard]